VCPLDQSYAPYGINSQGGLYDMIMVCHHLSPDIPSDVALRSRIRAASLPKTSYRISA
jgi:urease alpha subunit